MTDYRRAVMPSTFAAQTLHMPLYPRQAEIVDSFAKTGSFVTGRTCNEAGKTQRIITLLILWHIYMAPRLGGNGGVITTSGSWNQVKNQLVPSLRQYSRIPAFADYEFMAESISYKGFPQWIGFATNNPGAAEGFHGTPESPLLAIIDEAKSVPDDIISTIESRVNPQRFGMFSSPGGASGRFYRSHTSEEGWQRFMVPASECPHISKESIARRIARHGEQSPLVRSMIYAEFMESVEGGVITLADLDKLQENPPPLFGTDRHCFCDFAAGGDENVIAYRQGNRVRIVDAWTDKDTMSSVGRFITRFNELQRTTGLKQEEIEGDADGMGGPMIDRLAEAGWTIGRFHGGSTPRTDAHHKNLITEVWHTGAEKIRDRQVSLPLDDVLRGQLIDRKTKYESTGKLWMETKDELRRRGVGSPDRADAVLGAIAPGQYRGSHNLVSAWKEEELSGKDWLSPQSDREEFDDYRVEGAHCG